MRKASGELKTTLVGEDQTAVVEGNRPPQHRRPIPSQDRAIDDGIGVIFDHNTGCRRVTSGVEVTRAHAVREKRSVLQLLRMTIISAPDELRAQVRDLTRMQLIRLLAAWRPDVANATDPVTAYRVSLKSLARRYLELTDEIVDRGDLINPIVKALAPQLLKRVGIGIEVAGQMLVTVGGESSTAGVRLACER